MQERSLGQLAHQDLWLCLCQESMAMRRFRLRPQELRPSQAMVDPARLWSGRAPALWANLGLNSNLNRFRGLGFNSNVGGQSLEALAATRATFSPGVRR